MNTESFLAKYPVFSLASLIDSTREDVTKNAVLKRLRRAIRKNRVVNLVRGVYATVPYGADPQKYHPDQYLVMYALRPDSIFCGHSALELNGVGYSVWYVCTAYTQGRYFENKIRGITYQTLHHKTPLVKVGKLEIGVRKVLSRPLPLKVLGPERILVEGLQDPSYYGGYPELLESLLSFSHFDLDLLLEIADLFSQSKVYAALGWFLEQYKERFFIPNEYLKTLESRITFTRHVLDSHGIDQQFDKRWKLWYPRPLLQAGKVY